MRKVKVKKLTVEAFQAYGTFANMLNPKGEKIGAKPIEFYRDMLQQELGTAHAVSFSICRVEKRPLVVDVSEYHSSCGEGALPLDNDVLMHVAPASPSNGTMPVDKIVAFRVPKGTMVLIKPGVWHHAVFTANQKPANVLIVLPERTYANDCKVFPLNGDDQVKIG